MKTQKPSPALLPYRDSTTNTIKYARSPYFSQSQSQAYHSPYDSDHEPLVAEHDFATASELSEYDLEHFTATGKPAPLFKASGLANLGGHMYSVPQLLPKRYTDDSIIPAIVADVIPRARKPSTTSLGIDKKKGSFLSKIRRGSKDSTSDFQKTITKVVYMPRREYLKFFARDKVGGYVGSEPFRKWTEEELEIEFGKYGKEKEEENRRYGRRREGLLRGT